MVNQAGKHASKRQVCTQVFLTAAPFQSRWRFMPRPASLLLSFLVRIVILLQLIPQIRPGSFSVPPPVATARVAADEVQRHGLLSLSWSLQVQGIRIHVNSTKIKCSNDWEDTSGRPCSNKDSKTSSTTIHRSYIAKNKRYMSCILILKSQGKPNSLY